MTRQLVEAFGPMGAKMRPDMTDHQADFWASAIITALSDLPHFCVLSAIREAMHIPYQFPTEMEAGVRSIAERRLAEHKTAIHRLRAMQDEIHRAANPQPQIVDANATDEPMSIEEIRQTPKQYRTLGVSVGAIRPEDLAIVEAEEAAKET
jgi:hypothetical protein